MKPGEETRDVIAEMRAADAEIEKYCKERGLAQPYSAPWPGSAISCGRAPLPVVILALIQDNQRMHDELQQLRMDAGL